MRSPVPSADWRNAVVYQIYPRSFCDSNGDGVIDAHDTVFNQLRVWIDANHDGVTDAQLVDAMLAHPILINRPIVVTPMGTRLCRPSEQVLDILPQPQRGAFTKEDGEVVINEKGLRV